MSITKRHGIIAALCRNLPFGLLLMGPFVQLQAAPMSLDELLRTTRQARQEEERMHKEREAAFLAQRDKRAALLAEARAEHQRLSKAAADLSASFDANEKKLTELQQTLESRSGSLGEIFGVVKQVSGDVASVLHNSMITAQYPDRDGVLNDLSQAKTLPSMGKLEAFWYEMLREMTETAHVSRFRAKVIQASGEPRETQVVRIGPFTAVADGKYLTYLPTTRQLTELSRQPSGHLRAMASSLGEATTGFVKAVVDPSRGVILALYSQRPTLVERINQGGVVAYVIITVGLIGALLAVFQFFHLWSVGGRVKRQLRQLKEPRADNPLGRVIGVFKGDPVRLQDKESAEVLELRLSEAVLRELPALERFQSFLKLTVAAGPLLGLVGTVVGMIVTFQSMTESGAGDPQIMAAGISQAMVNTVLGLGVAVPLLFVNAALAARSRSIIQVLDEQAAGLLAERLEAEIHA